MRLGTENQGSWLETIAMATFKHTEKAFTVPEHHWVDVNSLGCLPIFSCWKRAEALAGPHTHTHLLGSQQVSPSRDHLAKASSLRLLRSQRAEGGEGGTSFHLPGSPSLPSPLPPPHLTLT